MATKSETTELHIHALKQGRVRLRMIGTTPLYFHAMSVKAKRDLLDRLGPHAARRNIHPNSLARLIVETVVDEAMIDAVLDDLETLDD